jgi:hypothetical protein
MILDGVARDEEAFGDSAGVEPSENGPDDVALAPRELVRAAGLDPPPATECVATRDDCLVADSDPPQDFIPA